MASTTAYRQPPNPKVKIEFTPGVWTTLPVADVDLDDALMETQFGRSSDFANANAASFTVALHNESQNYTPENPASPYYPNIAALKRIQYSYTTTGGERLRFTGYIEQWLPLLVENSRPVVQINAHCRMGRFQRVRMQSPLMTEYMADSPVAFWPLTDAATQFKLDQYGLDVSGQMQTPLRVGFITQEPLSFGDAGPGYGDGSGVKFAPGSAGSGQILGASQLELNLSAFTWELWVNAGNALPAWVTGSSQEIICRLVRLRDLAFDGVIGINPTGRPYVQVSTANATGPTSIVDGGWHHIVVTRASSGGNMTLYVDGSNRGTTSASPAVTDMDYINIGVGASSAKRFQGNVGYVALYAAALSAGRISTHYQAGQSYSGDHSDLRLTRYLGAAGLTTPDWNLDAGQITIGRYPQAGTNVMTACQDIATSEGGGSVFYVTPDGTARFVNRRYRDSRTPKLTLDAQADLDPSGYVPSLDATTLSNEVTANRSGESGTLTSQTWTDPVSAAQYGVASSPDSVTTYTTSDTDALNLASWIVAALGKPRLRFPQIAVDLMRADHDLYDAIGQLQIGDRIRLTNIPAVAYPVSTLDFFLEGWKETPGTDSYMWVADLTAADNPKRWLWDTSVWDGGDVWAL